MNQQQVIFSLLALLVFVGQATAIPAAFLGNIIGNGGQGGGTGTEDVLGTLGEVIGNGQTIGGLGLDGLHIHVLDPITNESPDILDSLINLDLITGNAGGNEGNNSDGNDNNGSSNEGDDTEN